MELVGARDGAGGGQQVQRRALRAAAGLDHGLVLGAILVGLEQDAVELLAHGFGAMPGGQLAGPGLDLRRDLLLALDAQQRRLDGVFRRLLEQPAAQAAEVVRRLEQPQQRRGLVLGAGLGVEVLARQIGEAELGLGRELPGQVEVDLVGQRAGARQQLGRRGLVEAQHQVRGLDLDALAGVELHLQRVLGLGHHAPGVEAAGVVEEGVHAGIVAAPRMNRSG